MDGDLNKLYSFLFGDNLSPIPRDIEHLEHRFCSEFFEVRIKSWWVLFGGGLHCHGYREEKGPPGKELDFTIYKDDEKVNVPFVI